MNFLQHRVPNTRTSNAELVGALRKSLDNKYGQVLRAAHGQWERSFAGKDPSDACVTVRISGRSLPASRRRFSGALAYGL
jgi:hypothetical protein